MKDLRFYRLGMGMFLLLMLPILAQAGIYKWYDEQGDVHYSQSPPPKGSRLSPIDTDTFSTLEMRKIPASSLKSTPKRKRISRKQVRSVSKKKRTTRSTCPLKR